MEEFVRLEQRKLAEVVEMVMIVRFIDDVSYG